MYKKKAMYKKKLVKVPPPTKKVPHIKIKEVRGDKNGKTRVVQVRKSVSGARRHIIRSLTLCVA